MQTIIRAFYHCNVHIKIYPGQVPGWYIIEGRIMGRDFKASTTNAELYEDSSTEADLTRQLLAHRTCFRILRTSLNTKISATRVFYGRPSKHIFR